MSQPIIKPGVTVVRVPIRISGFIEMHGLRVSQVVVDRFDYEYSAWPRVSEHGSDEEVIQIDNGPDDRYIEADADIVSSIRTMVDRFYDPRGTPWIVSDDVDGYIKGTRSGQ